MRFRSHERWQLRTISNGDVNAASNLPRTVQRAPRERVANTRINPADLDKSPGTKRLNERRIKVEKYKQNWSDIKRELNVTGRNEAALNCGAARRIAMFAGRLFATVASASYQCFCGVLAIVGMLMVVMAAVTVMMTGVLVIARVGIFDFCKMLILTVLMRLTRASLMETAPEYRVHQHGCDGDEFARGVHVRIVRVRKPLSLSVFLDCS